jgi:CRISPR-associated protein Csm3
MNLQTLTQGFKYTEWKFENAIDRITSAANPRQIERVPRGAEFEFELIYNVEDASK